VLLVASTLPLQKLFAAWAQATTLPPDALKTWKDAQVDMAVMELSTFLKLLSTHEVVPVRRPAAPSAPWLYP
jgi:hypothetical protein